MKVANVARADLCLQPLEPGVAATRWTLTVALHAASMQGITREP